MASSADCMLAEWVNVDRRRLGVMVGCGEGAVKLSASVYR
jgi:hypothetical protein